MNLKQLARDRGTNLKKVAEKCGIPPTTLYAISRGDTNFDNVGISIAIKVAGELGMTVEELYTGEIKPMPLPELPSDERELLSLYRRMDKDMARQFIDSARVYVAASEKYRAGTPQDVGRVEVAVR